MNTSPDNASIGSAHQVQGARRRIRSSVAWPRSARPSTRSAISTADPMTTEMPSRCTVCTIGGAPGTFESR